MEKQLSCLEQHKLVSKMLGYDFDIHSEKGKENVVADALSRIHDEQISLHAISSLETTWMEKSKTNRWKIN